MSKRVILIVLDSVGIGELPDASLFGDAGANTLGHIAQSVPGFSLPNLQSLGLGNIGPETGLSPVEKPQGVFGKAAEKSPGKDTTTGHWEIGGWILQQAFPVFLEGFPDTFIREYENRVGLKTIGNKAASGTAILDELGPHHLDTGDLIVYTSADSVFQVAAHEKKYPVKHLYDLCSVAREMLQGELAVGRVIARPFLGQPGNFSRTPNRKDFSLPPPGKTILDLVKDAGMDSVGVGKISDIYAGQGLTASYKSMNNADGIKKTLEAMNAHKSGIIMTNLVDFDQQFGHRRDVKGYAGALLEFDACLPEILSAMKDEDLLLITADHGNDPTAPGTDHTREFVPVILSGKMLRPGTSVGVRDSFSDLGATITDFLGAGATTYGNSFLQDILA